MKSTAFPSNTVRQRPERLSRGENDLSVNLFVLLN